MCWGSKSAAHDTADVCRKLLMHPLTGFWSEHRALKAHSLGPTIQDSCSNVPFPPSSTTAFLSGSIRTTKVILLSVVSRCHSDLMFAAPDAGVSKDDQWLGVTVRSQGKGGYVMVCS